LAAVDSSFLTELSQEAENELVRTQRPVPKTATSLPVRSEGGVLAREHLHHSGRYPVAHSMASMGGAVPGAQGNLIVPPAHAGGSGPKSITIIWHGDRHTSPLMILPWTHPCASGTPRLCRTEWQRVIDRWDWNGRDQSGIAADRTASSSTGQACRNSYSHKELQRPWFDM